jgi:chromosomal replication initiation ATPase DnaA
MSEQNNKLMAHNAVERVCGLLGDVSTAQIWSKERTFRVASARQLVYWYLWKICELGYNEIGRAMNKTHVTIMYGVRQIEIMLERNRTKEDRRIVSAAEKLKAL